MNGQHAGYYTAGFNPNTGQPNSRSADVRLSSRLIMNRETLDMDFFRRIGVVAKGQMMKDAGGWYSSPSNSPITEIKILSNQDIQSFRIFRDENLEDDVDAVDLNAPLGAEGFRLDGQIGATLGRTPDEQRFFMMSGPTMSVPEVWKDQQFVGLPIGMQNYKQLLKWVSMYEPFLMMSECTGIRGSGKSYIMKTPGDGRKWPGQAAEGSAPVGAPGRAGAASRWAAQAWQAGALRGPTRQTAPWQVGAAGVQMGDAITAAQENALQNSEANRVNPEYLEHLAAYAIHSLRA